MRNATVVIAVTALIFGWMIAGCSNEPQMVMAPAAVDRVVVPDSNCVTLYAGQTISAGSVCFSIENNTFCVTYATTGGWELVETHLWISHAGQTYTSIPMNNAGNPIPGQFPLGSGDITGATSWTACVDLTGYFGLNAADENCDPVAVYVAANATVRRPNSNGGYQTEGAWGDGDRINPSGRGSWATYSTTVLTCEADQPPEPNYNAETAWAYSSAFGLCFLQPPVNELVQSNNWGWTNGPLAEGDYLFVLRAGAGQCSGGTEVGTLAISYHAGIAQVTYATSTGFDLLETQFYVGSDMLPSRCTHRTQGVCDAWEYTVAPGQFPMVADNLNHITSATYTVSGLEGEVYVAAHSVVWGSFE